MKKTIICILAAVCMMGSASAQQAVKKTPTPMNMEVNAMFGIRGGMDKSEPSPMYGGYFSAYNAKGLGFRAGVEASGGNTDMAKYVGVPVHFLWKYGYQRSVGSSLKAGVSNAAYNTVRSVLYGQKPDLERTLNSFILGLLQNMQFFAGITPSVLTQKDVVYFDIDSDSHDYSITSTKTSFGMSADLGLGMSFYAGPLEIGIIPAFHYMLTGNGLNYPQDSRLYYSTVLSLGLMF